MGGGSIGPLQVKAGEAFCDDLLRDLLSDDHQFPKTLLNKLEKGNSAEQKDKVGDAFENLCQALQEAGIHVPTKELDGILSSLAMKRRTPKPEDAREDSQILLDYLHRLEKQKLDELNKVRADIQFISEDIYAIRKCQSELRTRKEQVLDERDDQSDSGGGCEDSSRGGGYPLSSDDLVSSVGALMERSQLKVIAELNLEDLSHSVDIVSSMDFDADESFLAVAGTSKRITVFDFFSVTGAPAEDVRIVAEIPNGAKISCLRWNKFTKNHIASSDYDGVVTVWDVATCEGMMKFMEHEKRAWSIDFSHTEPSMLVSGSDDCTVKVWSTTQQASVLNIKMKANACSVKYNPDSSIHLAVGSADHNIHYYDLRNISHPIHVFRQRKAVSYVEFSSSSELISESTDSTLRLWDLKTCSQLRIFRGHINTKNFVGLSVSSRGYIATGSETDEVFLYHKALPVPIAWHSFSSPLVEDDDDDGDEPNTGSGFVSAVRWKGDGTTIVAANSRGMIRVLSLAL